MINANDADALTKAIEGETIVDLPGAGIGDDGATVLATALTYNSTVTTINLRGNNIGQGGATALTTLFEHNSTITDIDLSGTIPVTKLKRYLTQLLPPKK